MTKQRITEIEERINKATAGPWSTDFFVACGVFPNGKDHIEPGCCAYCGNPEAELVLERPAETDQFDDSDIKTVHVHRIKQLNDWREISSYNGTLIVGNYDYEEGGICTTKDDADFIINARTDLPDAVKEIRRLRTALELCQQLYETSTIGCPYNLWDVNNIATAALAEKGR